MTDEKRYIDSRHRTAGAVVSIALGTRISTD